MLYKLEVILVQEVLIYPAFHFDSTEEVSNPLSLLEDIEATKLVLMGICLLHGVVEGLQ